MRFSRIVYDDVSWQLLKVLISKHREKSRHTPIEISVDHKHL